MLITDRRTPFLFIAGLLVRLSRSRSTSRVSSAGVGRSGTFIALDALLEAAEHQETIDVLDFTHQMR